MRVLIECFGTSRKWKLRSIVVLIMAVVSSMVAPGRAEQAPAAGSLTQETPLVLEAPAPRYRIQRGDAFELNFPFVPDFNQSVVVQPDGYVTLRVLGDIQVEGRTVPQLEDLFREQYSTILRDPVLTVKLTDFERPYFVAGGSLERPGKYELRGETTVIEAVAMAGGFRQDAKHSQVLIFRERQDTWVEVREVDMKAMLNRSEVWEDVYLRTGDMVFVPQNSISKVREWLLPSFSFLPYLFAF